jgi:hypothetical protein
VRNSKGRIAKIAKFKRVRLAKSIITLKRVYGPPDASSYQRSAGDGQVTCNELIALLITSLNSCSVPVLLAPAVPRLEYVALPTRCDDFCSFLNQSHSFPSRVEVPSPRLHHRRGPSYFVEHASD